MCVYVCVCVCLGGALKKNAELDRTVTQVLMQNKRVWGMSRRGTGTGLDKATNQGGGVLIGYCCTKTCLIPTLLLQ
jgi:hypothetical protein